MTLWCKGDLLLYKTKREVTDGCLQQRADAPLEEMRAEHIPFTPTADQGESWSLRVLQSLGSRWGNEPLSHPSPAS